MRNSAIKPQSRKSLGRHYQCFPNVTLTTVLPNRKIRTLQKPAPGSPGFTAQGVDTLLEKYAAKLEELFPEFQFRMVPLAGGRAFNFVYIPPDPAAQEQSA